MRMAVPQRLSQESGRRFLLSSRRRVGSMNRSVRRVMVSVAGLAVLGMSATLAGAPTGSAMARAPDAGCELPSEPDGIPAALDAAISGPADKDRACMKALLIPEARMMFVSLGADEAPSRAVGQRSYRRRTTAPERNRC